MKTNYFLIIALFFTSFLSAQIITIPDANFKNKLVLANVTSNQIAKNAAGAFIKIDSNSDGEIQQTEANEVVYLSVSYSNIASLEGITSFTNLETLFCEGNSLTTLNVTALSNLKDINCNFNMIANLNISGMQSIEKLRYISNQASSLNVSGCTNLKWLECWNNAPMTSLNVSGLTSLELLYTQSNSLTSINLANCTALVNFKCDGNELPTLDLSGLNSLLLVYCDGNNLTNLTVDNLPNLETLRCEENGMTSLTLSNLPALKGLYCYDNLLTSLDLASLTNLESLDFSRNSLTTFDGSNLSKLNYIVATYNTPLQNLFLKNGKQEQYIFINNNPNLRYICADESDLTNVQGQINSYNLNCHVNSYCSFVLGGAYYTIEGQANWDLDANGCTSADTGFPNLKYAIANGTTTGYLIGNLSGNYTIPVTLGNYTVTPVFENPTYYNVNPSNITVNFNNDESPAINDFCVTPNGIHSNLEVVISPILVAIPGFDAKYRVIYRNIGNQIENGVISVNFSDASLDFVTSNPSVSSQSQNVLTWNFTNLLPLQTRVIYFTLNVNSPMETPSVNADDILTYTATIASENTDENLVDNTSVLHQTVVNSYDPNDKTCLEGNTITPSMVGQYVHYMIRFENTGTFPAQNIVVKDMIDSTKFDVSSLIPLHSSHDYITRINGNKVEFIFEGINLPFDDANNDGYVIFKIKTKPTLVLGDTFTNNASIYFDYNFPIITNTTATTVTTLSTQDFEFNTYFTIYPNPAKQTLNINTKNEIGVKSVAIYNTLGQIVLAFTNAETLSSLDISQLKTGAYFIKLTTDKGTASQQFLKE
jgi:uncharacterized repeat protein (TIGR01451 family)